MPKLGNLIRTPEVRKKLGGVSDSTLTNWRKDRGFPEPVHLTARTLAWRESDVERWILDSAGANASHRQNRMEAAQLERERIARVNDEARAKAVKQGAAMDAAHAAGPRGGGMDLARTTQPKGVDRG